MNNVSIFGEKRFFIKEEMLEFKNVGGPNTIQIRSFVKQSNYGKLISPYLYSVFSRFRMSLLDTYDNIYENFRVLKDIVRMSGTIQREYVDLKSYKEDFQTCYVGRAIQKDELPDNELLYAKLNNATPRKFFDFYHLVIEELTMGKLTELLL